jgi:hypothetical protein
MVAIAIPSSGTGHLLPWLTLPSAVVAVPMAAPTNTTMIKCATSTEHRAVASPYIQHAAKILLVAGNIHKQLANCKRVSCPAKYTLVVQYIHIPS